MLRAIAAAKKKNEPHWCRQDRRLPGAAMFCRNVTWHQPGSEIDGMKNRISGLLVKTAVSHNKKRLHKVSYFREFLPAGPVA